MIGLPIDLCVDHRYMTDFLRVLDSDRTITLNIVDSDSTATCETDDGYGYVVMPLAREWLPASRPARPMRPHPNPMRYSRPPHDSDRPKRDPRRLSELMPQLLARRGYNRLLAHDQLQDAWEAAAGKLHSLAQAPGVVRNGVLEVIAKNSAVVQELTFQKRQLLKSLAAARQPEDYRPAFHRWSHRIR